MRAHVTSEQLKSALRLSDDLKGKIRDYEQRSWAANLSAPDLKIPWAAFLSKLEKSLKSNLFDDDLLISLIQYLSTLDTISLLEKIGELDIVRQTRFLQLLNWVAQESPDQERRQSAGYVIERMLMAYRYDRYREVYSQSRLVRAIKILSSM
jgi:hypothetical protein